MAAKNNNTWKLRKKHGRNRVFESPEALAEAAGDYFNWADKTPWFRNEPIKSGPSAGKILPIPLKRPYTLKALCHHIGISFKTWLTYKTREGFEGVVEDIEDFIYNQKLEGAIVGEFNPSIIVRELGLIDRQDRTTNGESTNKDFFEFLKSVNTKK
jgi:hypothetical protein